MPQWKNSNDGFNIPMAIIGMLVFFFLVIWLAPLVASK
jgi:hypothetical protein